MNAVEYRERENVYRLITDKNSAFYGSFLPKNIEIIPPNKNTPLVIIDKSRGE